MVNKLYPCKKCGTKVPIRSKGLCPKCRELERTGNGEKTMLNTSIQLPKMTAKTKAKKKLVKSIRDIYFSYHIPKCLKSEEAGTPIHEATKANICHILPKSTHPSVQANLDNCVYLTFSEHERFDQLLFRHEFDKIMEEFPNSWKIILKRFGSISQLCTEKTKLFYAIQKYVDINFEVWKKIPKFALYEISSFGRVRSNKFYGGKILKPAKTPKGYLMVGLKRDKVNFSHNIHKLVANVFLENPLGLPEVNHKDLNKTNNHKNNLEWVTTSENRKHYIENSDWVNPMKDKFNDLNHSSKKVIQLSKTGKFIKEFPSTMEVERLLNINVASISRCCNNKQKTAGGFTWKYK